MLRKVILLGEKTLAVSLPAEWLRLHGIEKGHSVEVDAKGSYLIVAPEKDQQPRPLRLDITGLASSVKRILGGAYKAGYDDIEFAYTNNEELEAVRGALDVSMKTFEILEQREGFIRIKNLSEVRADEFERVLRRMFLLILESLRELSSAAPEFEKVIERDAEVNNCADFCRRLLNRKGYVLYAATPALYNIIEQLEKVGDRIRDAAREGERSNATLEKVMRGFYELYYQFDVAAFDAWLRDAQACREKLRSGHLSTAAEELYALNGALLVCKFSLASVEGK